MNKVSANRNSRPDNALGGTSGRLLAILCHRGRRTVNELASELGLTDNAVRAQLERLQQGCFVSQTGSRPGARRPHADYDITPAGRRLFPTAYEPALKQLVDVLARHLPRGQTLKLLKEAGEELLARLLPPAPRGNPRQRLKQLLQKLEPFGAAVISRQDDGAHTLGSCACPLASLTASHPELCDGAADVLARALGTLVVQKCERGDFPRCRFEIRAPATARLTK
jgi:predicted ArsR family transcriptional regulator